MAEHESKTSQVNEKPKILIQELYLDTMKAPSRLSSSIPSTPTGLRKAASVRQNCLCSPTTHAGSFRCRYHRNNSSGLRRNSMSVGAKLSDLAGKSNEICDTLHTQLISGNNQG
ncbi:hypothetical protein ACJIZ3_010989 [Penstemon smallii]|uniref:Uncharacterized protein n=1 Tax=Penstemon smallii TaxID=265156 RepID=A0ABD3UI12_9LAMI